ncbi:hypothetical protein FOL46_002283 [Perkinsus olseni]|uniref:Cilia- and flagella-associated protein 43 n=1 Tax=Perkinsus olseni TaxID=32597 RepID=A0A7J6M9P6_PEROL|nr:hypothetical protein FOL46_002283 [Perkinsus olseni]
MTSSMDSLSINLLVGGAAAPVFVHEAVLAYRVGNVVCVWDTETEECSYCRMPLDQDGPQQLIASHSGRLILASKALDGGAKVMIYPIGPESLEAATEITVAVDKGCTGLTAVALSSCAPRLFALAGTPGQQHLAVYSTETREALPGLEWVQLPSGCPSQRFTRILPYPKHKDLQAVIGDQEVVVASLEKTYETFMVTKYASDIITDLLNTHHTKGPWALSAVAWCPTGHLLVATSTGLLLCLSIEQRKDPLTEEESRRRAGSDYELLSVHCAIGMEALGPIRHMFFCGDKTLITVHTSNQINFWAFHKDRIPEPLHPDQLDAQLQSNGATQRALVLVRTSCLSEDTGHEGALKWVVTSPEGQTLWVCTDGGRLWSANMAVQCRTIAEEVDRAQGDDDAVHEVEKVPISGLAYHGSTHCGALDCVTDIKILPGREEHPTLYLVAMSSGALSVFGAETDSLPQMMYLQASHAPINCLAVSPSSRLVVVGSENGVVQTIDLRDSAMKVLDVSRGLESSAIKLGDGPVVDISVTKIAGGREVCYAHMMGGDVFLLTLREKAGLLSVVSHVSQVAAYVDAVVDREVCAVCWCGSRLAVAITDGRDSAVVTVSFDLDQMVGGLLDSSKVGVATQELPSSSKVTAMMSCGEGLILATIAGEVALYSLPSDLPSNATELPLVKVLHQGNRPICRLSMDGDEIAAAASDGTLYVLSLRNSHPSTVEHLHTTHGCVTAVAVSDGTVVSGRGNGGMFIWQVPQPGTVVAPSAEFTRLPERLEQTPPDNVQEEVVNDDELVVWSLKEHKRKMADAAAVRRSLDGREAQRIQLVQTVQREVEQLRARLMSIIESNQSGPEEEMLQRDEFCIDLEARQEVAEECERRSRELREKLKEEIASRAVIRDRLVRDFWDPMEVHMARLHCIEEERSLSVANYPFRSGTAAPDSSSPLLKKLRVLRDVQARKSVWLTDVACGCSLPVEDDALNPINICGGQEDYLINWGRCRWELPQPTSGTAESTKAAEDAARPPEAEPQADARAMERTASSFGGYISADPGLAHPCFPAGDTTSADFLYDPTELVSSPRRRIQVNLLNEMCMDYKRAFNTVFDRVKGEKTKAVEHISERVHRIHAILKELKSEESPPVDPAVRELPTGENPESVLEVSDKEIGAEKWISKEERARLDAEAAAETERLRKLQEDDGGRQKALITMMGGTLKTKKDLSPLEVRLEREEWMDTVPEDEMDEEQKAAFADQLAREKALAEEQEAYRTRLGEELEQLKAEIKESTAAFDDGLLKELYRTRVETDLKILTQELLVLQHHLALRQSQEDKVAVESLNQRIVEARKKVAECRAEFEDFSLIVRDLEREADEIVRQERDYVSNFKQQFSSANTGIDTEDFNQLLALFRTTLPGEDANKDNTAASNKNAYHGRSLMSHNLFNRPSSRSRIVGGRRQEDNEEFSYLDTMEDYELNTPTMDDIAVFQYPDDCPEGIDEELFGRAMRLRRERQDQDASGVIGNGSNGRRPIIGAAALCRLEKALSDEKILLDQLASQREIILNEKFDTEVAIMVRQGLLNLPEAPVATDCSDAIVVPAEEAIEIRNRHIIALAKEKLAVLHKIKEFRKKLNLVEWEQAVLALEKEDLEERSRDIQMMRVTKDLQTVLSESSKNPDGKRETKNVEDALKKLIEKVEQSGAEKEAALIKELELVKRTNDRQRKENEELKRKADELRRTVAQRESIRALQDSHTSQGAEGSSVYRAGEKRIPIGGGGRIEENAREIREAQARLAESRLHREQIDMARSHTKEIQKLRAVLDGYRQRTFPSFVHVHQSREAPDG